MNLCYRLWSGCGVYIAIRLQIVLRFCFDVRETSDPSHEANTLCDTQSSARCLVVLQTVTLGRKTLENQPTAAYICNLSESRDWLLAFDVTNGWKPW